MRNKICLLGMKDIKDFLNIISDKNGKIELFNPDTGYRIAAKSLVGLIMASTEWSGNTWIDSEEDIYSDIEKYIVIADDDTANIHE